MPIQNPFTRIALVLASTILSCATLAVAAIPAQATEISFGLTGAIGETGTGPAQFERPSHIAVDATTHDIYVADAGNNRIQELDPNQPPGSKRFVLMLGKEVNKTKHTNICTQNEIETEQVECQAGTKGNNTGEADFSEPQGVAVDNSSGTTKGDIYVSDTGNNRIIVFTNTGTYITEFNGTKTPNGSFAGPQGLTIDEESNVYITDQFHEVVDKFTPLGTSVFASPYIITTPPNDNPTDVVVNNTPGKETIFVANRADDVGAYNYTTGAEQGIIDEQAFPDDPTDVALDKATGDIFVSGRETIREYTGVQPFEKRKKFGNGDYIPQPATIAVDPGIETHLYVGLSQENKIDIFSSGHEPPTVETLPVPPSHPEPPLHSSTPKWKLEGFVNPNGSAITECYFEYGKPGHIKEHKHECTPIASKIGEGKNPVPVSAIVEEGLIPCEEYEYLLFAASAEGTGTGAVKSFTTEPAPPTVEDREPSVVATRTSALLSGTIDPENCTTTSCFEYASQKEYEQTKTYSHKTRTVSAGKALGDVPVGPEAIAELQPETVYHYRLAASNSAGTVNSNDHTFSTTPRTPPLVTTGETSSLTQTSATITGTVNPRGLPSSYELELGTEVNGNIVYNGPKAFGDAGQDFGSETLTIAMQGLAPGTTYHYRLLASNADGTAEGADRAFTTPGYPSPIALPPALPLLSTSLVLPIPEVLPKHSNPPKLSCREKAEKLKNASKRKHALKLCSKATKKKTHKNKKA